MIIQGDSSPSFPINPFVFLLAKITLTIIEDRTILNLEMASEKLEKLEDSVGLFKKRYLSLLSERDSLKGELEGLREKTRNLEMEKEEIREKIDILLESIEDVDL